MPVGSDVRHTSPSSFILRAAMAMLVEAGEIRSDWFQLGNTNKSLKLRATISLGMRSLVHLLGLRRSGRDRQPK